MPDGAPAHGERSRGSARPRPGQQEPEATSFPGLRKLQHGVSVRGRPVRRSAKSYTCMISHFPRLEQEIDFYHLTHMLPTKALNSFVE